MNKTTPKRAKKILEEWQKQNGGHFTKKAQLKAIAQKYNRSPQTIRRILKKPEDYGIEVKGKISSFKKKRVDINNNIKELKTFLFVIIPLSLLIILLLWIL